MFELEKITEKDKGTNLDTPKSKSNWWKIEMFSNNFDF